MNRALRAAVMGALVLSPVALGACSAGQVSQTGTQDRDKVGPQAQVEDILLRQVLLAPPENGRYEEGDDAELILTIVNASDADDTLTGIEGEGFDGVLVSATGPTPSPSSPAGSSPTATPTPGSTGATPGTSAGGTASTRVSLDVPADTALYIGREDGATVTLQDLGEELTAGQTVTLTLTFEQAGEITTQALVAGPDEEIERGESFDFEEGLEEENPENEEDTQAE
ncbi:hypothetical protein ACI79J_14595 [Geodermatophilus sp. SYSU D01062]